VFKTFRNSIFLLMVTAGPLLLYSQEPTRENKYRSLLERGYALSEEKPAEALEAFRAAHRLIPSDTLALQIAFVLNGLGRNQEALEAFMPLSSSTDPRIREQAQSAVFILEDMQRAGRSPLWIRTSTAALYDSRFRDGILWLTLQGGYHLNNAKSLSATLTLSIDADTRSDGTAIIPEIFSDNFILLAPGIRIIPFGGMTLDLSAGLAYNTKLYEDRSRTQGDVRAVASYGLGIYPIPTSSDRLRFDGTFFADAGISAGYYSRYDNGIAYLQGRTGVRLLELGPSAFDPYIRVDFAADTRREFYNNFVEGGLGIRVIPHHAWGVNILFEAKRGLYVGNSRLLASDGSSYGTVRLFLILDRFF
jgi:hypothetical protein